MSKTRMGKRVASLLLSLVMMLSLLPTTVYAEGADTGATNDAVVEETIAPVNAEGVDAVANAEGSGDEEPGVEGNEAGNEGETSVTYVAQVGDVRYKTLEAAIGAANAGDTITLLADIELTAMLTAKDKDFTLDLNGCKFNDSLTALNLESTKLTVQDTSGAADGMLYGGYTGIIVDSNSTLTVKSGTVKGDLDAVVNYGVVNIEGTAKLQRNSSGFSVKCKIGSITKMTDGTVFDIGTIENSYDYTVSISGGVVENYVYATSVTGGTIKDLILIEGGEISNATINGYIRWLDDTVPTLSNVALGESAYVKNEGYCFNSDKDAIVSAVAAIGDTKYADLAAAIKAAKTGQTVTLLKDITLSSVQSIGNKKLTLDLNGKTLSSTAYQTIKLDFGADLTVKDSVGGGRIANTYTKSADPATIYLKAANTKFTLESGTIESDPNKTNLKSVAINSESGATCTVNINGGSVIVPAAATEGRGIVAGNGMTLNISGGTIAGGLHGVDAYSGSNVTITGGEITARVVDTGRIEEAYGMRIIGTANVTVAGGMITGVKMDDDGYKLNVPNVTLKSGKINGSFYSITEGTITFTVDDNATITFVNGSAKKFLPDTVELVQNANGTYGIKAGTYVAQIGSTGYETLAEAIAAAQDGDTVTLLTDCSGDGIVVNTGIFATEGLTVDFGGHSYTVGGKLVGSTGTASNGFQLNKDNKITFKNGAIYGDASVAGDDETDWTGAPAIMIQNYCDLTLTGMTISGGEETVYTMSNNNGNVVIKDSIINAGKASSYGSGPFAFDVCRYASYPSVTVTVKGNSVINGDVEVSGTIGEGQSRQLYVEGGKFTGEFKVSGNVPANIAISGGTFSIVVPEEYCAAGFIPTQNEDGSYGVKVGTYVASIGNEKYASLTEAVAAAKADETVTLLADIEQNSQLTINQSITLDLAGKKIYNTEDIWGNNANAILSITNGAKVTITGNGTIDAKENDCYTINVVKGDLTIENGTFYGNVSVVQVEEGTLSVKGGTFDLHQKWEGSSKYLFNCIDDAYMGGSAKVAISGGTFIGFDPNVSPEQKVDGKAPSFAAPGVGITKNADGTFTAEAGKVAQIIAANGSSVKACDSLAEAITAASRNATVKLLADTGENVTIDKALTLDLNGFTLNGSTGERKPALTVTARVTVKDSSKAQTGTIMREDTAGNSGVSSHYVIDVQGAGWLTFESGNVKNDSGAGGTNGASLVRVGSDSVGQYPGLNIKGGTFTQNNFIVIKVDRGDLFLNGGTLNSDNTYAIENWHRATIKGGTVNGTVAAWTYSGGLNSDLTISGGTINGDVTSVNYGNAENRTAKVSITGGAVNGTLDTRSYDPTTGKLTSITDAAKATIEVTGGTFKNDPTKYVVENSAVNKNADGTFGVAKAYLAKVGNTSYYTMDEAFKAQTASGQPIVLLRDYTTGSTFNSGTVARVVDLGSYTWTCTGTDANSAAFEINNPNASLTVKNGKIVSSQLVGLIPSASGGTITYDNSSLTFENVEMSTTATSGIETNGNNTDDTVTLKDSTLNVPNGFGIYFPSSGKLTIENSKINAKTMGVQVCSGSLSINEGSAITVTGDAVPKTENDGAIQDGAAISIVNRTGYKGLGDVTVFGGKFTAKEGNSAIKAYNWADKTETDFTAKDKVAVSGGTFSSAVKEEYCAAGYIPTKNEDGSYGVKEGSYEARVDGTGYEDVDEALTVWAANGGTLTLLDDCTTDAGASGSWYFNVQKTATLDLNGKTLTLGANKYIGTPYDENNPQTLTIQDSAEGGKLIGTYFYVIQGSWSTTVIVNGGEICNTNNKGALLNNGPVVVNGGKLTGGTYGVSTNSDFTMTKGEINILTLNARVATAELGAVDGVYTDVKIGTLTAVSNATTVNFNSGIVDTFSTSYSPTLNATENAYFVNTFTNGLPSGKMLQSVEKDGANYYQLADLTEADAAAKVTAADGTPMLYADAGTAASALRAGGTLTLLKDHNGDTLRVNKDVTGSVTIDLNGKTVTNSDGPALYVVINGSSDDTEPYTVTVRGGGTLKSENNVALRVSAVNNAADVVVEDMTLNPAAGQTAIDLQNAARLVYTDEATAQAQIGNGYVVTVDGKNYAFGISGGFVYAVKQLPAAGGTVKLLDNYAGSQKLSYTNDTGKPVVLDLNGKTYSYTSKGGTAALEFARSNSNLTVKNGTIISAATYAVCGVLTPNYPSSSANDLKLTLDSVTLKATNGSGLGVNGTLTGNETVIKNSIIEAADTGIYYPTAGTLTIENSTITGAKLGVAVKGGTVNISGDATAISATADAKEPANYYTGGDGAIEAEGYALYVEGGYGYDITLNIAGGTFESKGDAVKKFVKDEDTLATRTIAISGGTYSTKPEETWVVNGYRAIKNTDGSYTVEIGEYTVKVTSDTTTGTGSMATVSGGGIGSINSAVEVSAPAVSGYTFVGWYLNSYNGEKLSDQPKYTYKPTADCTLVAVYEIPAGGTFKLTVDGQGINVNNDAQGNHYLAYLAVGSEITLECTNDNFMFWVNSSDNIVSTKKVLTITLVGDSAYRAVTADNGNDFALVIFKNTQSSGGQELSAARYTSESTISFPANPSLYGRTFKNWAFMDDTNTVATESAIQERIKAGATSIIVVPVFEVTGTYTVTVQYVDKANEKIAESTVSESQYTGAMIKVEAKPMIDGKYFSHWADESGEVVLSTKQTYVVCAVTNTTIKAVYVTNESDKEQAADKVTLTTNASKNGAKWRVTLVMNYAITDDHTILQRGFLYWPTNTDLSVENKEYLKYREWGGTDSNNGATVLNLNTSNPGKMIYARAYVIVKDASGNTQTIYSEPIAVSYNIITGATGN